MEKLKKPFYKRWYGITIIIFGAMFVIGVIQLALESPAEKANRLAEERTKDSIAHVEHQNYEAKREQEKANKGEISMEKFEQIQTGMDKTEVDRLLGDSGELSSSMDVGSEKHEVYTYKKTGLVSSKHIIITYSNKKMTSKLQGGL